MHTRQRILFGACILLLVPACHTALAANRPPDAVIQVTGKTITDGRITVDKGEAVQFVGDGSTDPDGDALSYHWTFGDGATSDGANPTHTYAQAGTYTVALTVDDGGPEGDWPEYPASPFVISVAGQPQITGRGGLLIADVTGDGLMDYLVTTKDDPLESESTRATIGAYDHGGTVLWVKDPVDLRINGNMENYGLPGWSGPGIATGDVDGDGVVEVLHIDTQDRVVIRSGLTGAVERTWSVPLPVANARWGGIIQVVDLRGQGDRDAILQAEPAAGGIFAASGRNQPLTGVNLETGQVIWDYTTYYGCKHNGFRACDIDGDGLDEVVGGIILDQDGTRMNSWDYRSISGHFDSVFIYDVRPDLAGLEIVLLEESGAGDDRTAIVTPASVLVYASRSGNEPQNAAVGDFDPGRAGLEIWNRSRFNDDQRPWVLDSRGNVIAQWIMNDVKPADWSTRGVEFINVIDWYGGDKKYCAAKERHTEGKVCVFDAMTGEFVEVWQDQASRIQAADVSGDYREEIVVQSGPTGAIHVYWNDEPNTNPPKPRYWENNWYRRQKQNFNYYSP